ncbi:MAG: alpha/beta hydrolase [Actinomycetota bacterium]|nr:alpha/beta hydrolase [Actinomycetota bacterium]
MGDIRTDVLGEPFTAETITLPDDAEGPVVATLVHRPAGQPSGTAVLYVHGFCDYFFQLHVAEFFTDLGYDFYALDLRKHGRSLLLHQTPNFCLDLAEYFAELDAAHQRITARDDHAGVIVVAHSTGGLIAPLWAHERQRAGRGVADAFVLNGPWLDLRGSLLLRTVGTRAIDELGARLPYRVIPRSTSEVYVESLHAQRRGEWEFDTAWKPPSSFPVRAGWLRAVRRGHRTLHRGIDTGAPVLVLASTRTTLTETWSEDVRRCDVVLDVQQIARWSHTLGPRVTIARIDGAMHDAYLSAKDVREEAFEVTRRWIESVLD